MNYIERIMRFAQVTPDAIALVIDNTTYSYKTLCQGAVKIAAQLKSFHIEHIACFGRFQLELFQTILATQITNSFYLPLHAQGQTHSNKTMLDLAATRWLAVFEVNSDLLELLSISKQLQIITFNENIYNKLKAINSKHTVRYFNFNAGNYCYNQTIDLTRIAYILFTSGTTNKPKAVAIKKQQLNDYLINVSQQLILNADDKFLLNCSLTFDLSIHEILLSWYVGACLYVFSELNPLNLFYNIVEVKITIWLLVPAALNVFLQIAHKYQLLLLSLRYQLFCGEILKKIDVLYWRKIIPKAEIINLYGPTEATIAISSSKVNSYLGDPQLTYLPVGWAFQHQHIALIGKQNELIMTNHEIGEIFLRGSQVISEYYKQNYAAAFLKLTDHCWYRTGDMAYMHPNYGLVVVGRNDDQWQIAGYRVEKSAIECAIRSIIYPHEVAVGLYTVTNQQQVLAFLTCTVNQNELYHQLRKTLPLVAIPKRYIYVKSLPKNTNHKIDYKILMTQYLQQEDKCLAT